jgi:glucose/arabinose dehydrogenase
VASSERRLVGEQLEDRCLLANLPAGFIESAAATGLSNATAMEIAPNGDLWVLEQGGAVKRFRPGSTTADVVGDLSNLGLSSVGERGVLGIAFDPQYATNKHVYLYYTSPSPVTHNRISQFTVNDSDATDYYFAGANSQEADAGSSGAPTAQIIFDLDPLSGLTNHNGGAIHFGPDGKLYVAVGDNANGANSQSLATDLGKMLRINSDGTIPADNPFFGVTTGNNQAIWALGLRNPYTFAFQPWTGRVFINDVGQNTWEEIDEGLAGANYGWPATEGNQGTPPSAPGTYRGPLYTYQHGGMPLQGFAITGGAFYNPEVQQFPAAYTGKYFFADYVNDWIDLLDVGTGTATQFATSVPGPVDLRVTSDGSLYYLARNAHSVYRVAVSPVWAGYAGNAQHTAVSTVASQTLETINWQTPVDLAPQYSGTELFIHYGSPVVTAANTVIVPVKIGTDGGFEVEAIDGGTGIVKWTQKSDYVLPPHNWTPSYGPTLTPANRLYFAGAGGTVYYVDSPDASGTKTVGQLAFYGLANYTGNKAALDGSVFINTPITSDRAGNIYFGFEVTGPNPANLQSGIARIAADGTGTWISAAAAAGDANITKVAMNAAPALSNDGQKVYVAVSNGDFGYGYLLALDSNTLQRIGASGQQVRLRDPDGSDGVIADDGTASPTVGPDGDVYFGVLENPLSYNHYRGWLLHFSGDLSQRKTPGAFGWDDTASVVPASMVPGYHGTSSYLLMTKYNNYAGGAGDGVNKIAILDPQGTMSYSAGGQNVTVMSEVLTIAGVTPDPEFGGSAVREWCINTAAVDPQTDSVLVNNEDGKLYRWDLGTNTFTEQITLTSGIGEAYTPTVIGADGKVYAINNATLFAVGLDHAPVAIPLSEELDEDSGAYIQLAGTDAENSPLTFTIVSGPAHGSLSGDMPLLLYKPAPDYFGSDSFTYKANDGQLDSAPVTVSLTIDSFNDSPSFQVGADQVTTDESGPQVITAWATGISPGPANESDQTVQFVPQNNSNPAIFSVQPSVDPTGTLTFTPKPNAKGTAEILILLADSGGGTSPARSFLITVDKPHPLHNTAHPLNVLGCVDPLESGPPCIYPTASDVIAVINYINARGSGPIVPTVKAPPYPDVTADNNVAADDVVTIINYINAHPMIGQSEAEAVDSSDDVMLLLAMDVAGTAKRKA